MKTPIAQFGLLALCVACTGLPATDKTDDGNNCDTTDYLYDTAGCGDTGTETGTDTGQGVYTGATTLDSKTVSCTSHQFDFTFMTVGLTGGGELQINGAQWEETHYVGSTDFDPNGWWDTLELTLPHVDPDTNGDGVGDTYGASEGYKYQEDNTASTAGNTLYNCNIYDNDRMTFQITVFDEDNTKADCAVWGPDPGAFEDGCETWN